MAQHMNGGNMGFGGGVNMNTMPGMGNPGARALGNPRGEMNKLALVGMGNSQAKAASTSSSSLRFAEEGQPRKLNDAQKRKLGEMLKSMKGLSKQLAAQRNTKSVKGRGQGQG